MPNDTTQTQSMQGTENEQEMNITDVLEALVAAVTALESRVDVLEAEEKQPEME